MDSAANVDIARQGSPGEKIQFEESETNLLWSCSVSTFDFVMFGSSSFELKI